MRFDIAKSGNGLTYEIRNIVNIANKLQESGMEIYWENIGDPILKGEKLPDWIKETLKEIIEDDATFGYSPTKGVDETREFLAELNNQKEGAQITKEDIIFFNGLGDAIARSYSAIRVDARIIMPEPTYSTHLLAEVLHASFPPNTYRMNPYNNWAPDLNELERKVKSHRSIVGILVINPDNPTGYVYDKETLLKIVEIAKKYDLFLVFDEIYNNMVYNGKETVSLAEIIGDVPGMSMKGISKEVPWPGARCGWIEVYNIKNDEAFERYINAILQQKMAEVCSTTFPQMAIPKILSNPKYQEYLNERLRHYEKLSNIAYNILKDVPYIVVNRTNGAFYMSVVFIEAVLNNKQTLPISNPSVKDYVEKITNEPIENDKRFVYYLLASTGICVVPLTSFFTPLPGFRMTLLEKDVDKFEHTVKTLAEKIVEYVESSK
ncbi:aspartate transaminase [Deferribacter desulfuricans SSM1]|uniref:alanine transaminase n=1 Tax=Deferribacter desulfuricans (strain DSM 14783 / JCM 11476 / NBRC 101012 / SSM1) TaxID=639282 RepID=D3PBX8_DEFDS|nr:pyridoxal phosphate-dependent aminotransferase [Deferribacter desulfuricans]BAI80101.1 aspartate transaminase [Deferribacter desulfuricans SSM1]